MLSLQMNTITIKLSKSKKYDIIIYEMKSIDVYEILVKSSRFLHMIFPCRFLLDFCIRLNLKLDSKCRLPIVMACMLSGTEKPTVFDTDRIYGLSTTLMKLMPKIYSTRFIASWSREKFKRYFNYEEISAEGLYIAYLYDCAMSDTSFFTILKSVIFDTPLFDIEFLKCILDTSATKQYSADAFNNIVQYMQTEKT